MRKLASIRKIDEVREIPVKLDQDFLMALNITVGRMRGWLRNEYEAANEFDITEDKARYWFARSDGQLLTPKSKLLLSFGS